jgi:hypothetical protein
MEKQSLHVEAGISFLIPGKQMPHPVSRTAWQSTQGRLSALPVFFRRFRILINQRGGPVSLRYARLICISQRTRDPLLGAIIFFARNFDHHSGFPVKSGSESIAAINSFTSFGFVLAGVPTLINSIPLIFRFRFYLFYIPLEFFSGT